MIDTAFDWMFWCTGCYGNMYPYSGAVADHVGGVASSSLLTTRIIAKMHRLGLARETSTDDSTMMNGKLCRKPLALFIKKSQYKLQMTYPIPSTTGNAACWHLGLSDTIYGAGREYPADGQDWGYLIWRKKNCCAF
jgi:conjugal transfer pilus assembly protein TraU